MTDSTQRRIGVEVRSLRARRGMSQHELAKRAGISRVSVSEIENGKRDPGSSTVAKLADALGVPAGALFGDQS